MGTTRGGGGGGAAGTARVGSGRRTATRVGRRR